MTERRCDVLDVREMLRCLRLGESARAVAKGLGVSNNTVREDVAWLEGEWLALHRNAFAFLGGVPRKIVLDYVARHVMSGGLSEPSELQTTANTASSPSGSVKPALS